MIERFGIVIGAAKSGTTSLYHYLAQHPQVAPCRNKEPNFFVRQEDFRKGITEYEKLWPDFDSLSHTVALEASTLYSMAGHIGNVAKFICAFERDFRFVYLLRDPIARIESHIGMDLAHAWRTDSNLTYENIKHYICMSRYHFQCEHYVDRFGADRLLLMTSDNLKCHPFVVLDRVCDHFGIDPFPREMDVLSKHNSAADRGATSALWHWAKRRVIIRNAGALLPWRTRERFRRMMSKRNMRPVSLSGDLRTRVLAELVPDLESLQADYGVDVDGWPSVAEAKQLGIWKTPANSHNAPHLQACRLGKWGGEAPAEPTCVIPSASAGAMPSGIRNREML